MQSDQLDTKGLQDASLKTLVAMPWRLSAAADGWA